MSTPNKVEVSQVNEVTTVEITTAGPQGVAGATGPAGEGSATVAIGTVTTGNAGTNATVTNVGSTTAATLNFTIPRGDAGAAGSAGSDGSNGSDGAAATIAVGSVSTGAAGSSATVTNSGSSSAATFDFAIPRGATGATGPAGADGAISDGDKGDIVVSNSGATFTIDNDAVTAAKLADTSVSAGNYTNTDITVDAQGRITAASSGSAGGVTSVTGSTPIVSSGGSTPAISISAATTSAAGSMSASDKSKLDGVEASATADQTASEIRTLVESATDSNVFTDADHTKLNAIEASATADQTGSEIKSLYEAESDTNAFSDAEKTKLSGIEASATADQTDEEIQDIVGGMLTGNTESGITVTYQDADGTIDFTVASQTDENFTTADHAKLDGIEASATADQTNAEIKTAYEANADTNVFTDAEKTKLTGIETSATADQTGAEIKTAYEAESNTNAFTDAEKSKLTAIEASADVTDATNVDAAGAVMNTDASTAAMGFVVDEDNMASNSATKVPSQQSVKAYVDANSSDTTYTAGTGLSLSGTTFNVDQIALTTVQTAANESAQLGLTTQEGDIVVRSDQNKSYVRNSGTAGTMADFTELLTPTDQVLSVNGNTGAITAAQIAAAVEAATDSNTFTDADHTKLNAIESGATADQTATEIKTSYESNSNTNAFTDAEQTKLSGVEASATADQTAAEIRTLVESASDSNVFTDADHTKLNAIEASATADQTGAEIKSLYEGESDTNAFTDAEKTKLSGIETSATADQTKSDIDALGIAATTAATLATARNIAGVSFDGSANISLNNNAITNGAGYIDGSALNAANLSSGTIPDARFPATLPAASAANLTSIPAANITGTLPAISGANLTNLPPALAGGSNENLFVEAENQMDSSFTTQSNFNYVALSPLIIASGATLTVSASSNMTFV